MTPEELEIAKAACCVGTIWDEYEGTEEFDHMVKLRLNHLIELVRKSQPSLPSNLDEAAEDSWAVYEYRESPRGLYYTCYVDGFKAGAEWMAGQGIKLHGRILPGPKCNLYIESDCFDRGYKGLNYSFSDSNDVDMFIQIRKK